MVRKPEWLLKMQMDGTYIVLYVMIVNPKFIGLDSSLIHKQECERIMVTIDHPEFDCHCS
jgi:hypothetical protein